MPDCLSVFSMDGLRIFSHPVGDKPGHLGEVEEEEEGKESHGRSVYKRFTQS